MAINTASLIVVEGNQLPDATTVASLAISLSSAKTSQMHKILGPKVRVVATKAMAMRAMVLAIVMLMGRHIARRIP